MVNLQGLRGATVARLTPDQKAACSNHVGVSKNLFWKAAFTQLDLNLSKGDAPGEAHTHGLQIMGLTLCQLSHRGLGKF